MLGALMRGISTREYHQVLPKMAETVGVSRSAVSRQAMEASIEQLKQLQERRWDQVEILVIYIDGQRFAEHHILSAVGVDIEGHKHVLGIGSGATENAAAVKQLLTGLRERGPTDGSQISVHHRRRQSPARCHRGGLWRGPAGAAVSQPQDRERHE